MLFSYPMNDEKSLSAAVGIAPFFLKENLGAARSYGLDGIEKALLLLQAYNLRSIGVNDAGTSDASLLKELVVKLMDKKG
jgi:DNA polymerase-3 subunit delta